MRENGRGETRMETPHKNEIKYNEHEDLEGIKTFQKHRYYTVYAYHRKSITGIVYCMLENIKKVTALSKVHFYPEIL